MPYITPEERIPYEETLKKVPDMVNKGHLEYLVYAIMQIYMRNRAFRYTSLHDCVYAVSHCAHEFERNYLDPREDEAKKTNGDIE